MTVLYSGQHISNQFQEKWKVLENGPSKNEIRINNIMIECGRWNKLRKVPFQDRLCQLCNTIEDGYHIIIECQDFQLQETNIFPIM